MKHILESTSDLSNGASIEVSIYDYDGVNNVIFCFTGVNENNNLVKGLMALSKNDLHQFIGTLLHVQSNLKNK